MSINDGGRVQPWAKEIRVHFPAQCSCGHLYLEKYLVRINAAQARPFVWCGFCSTRVDLELVDIPAESRALPVGEGGKA